jgi:hypothetical protein
VQTFDKVTRLVAKDLAHSEFSTIGMVTHMRSSLAVPPTGNKVQY